MKDLRIIIAGGRNFNDFNLLRKETNRIIKMIVSTKIPKECVTVISGGARGADVLGEKYAEMYGIKLHKIPANWERYGNMAGYIRNREMAKFAAGIDEEGDRPRGVLIAFWDGQSHGTKHMIETAKNLKLDVYVVGY